MSKLKENIKAMQIAFTLENKIACSIRESAAQEGLTPSDKMRKIVGLPYSPLKRPRLTLSLSEKDYEILAQKYQLELTNTLTIKKKLIEELVAWINS